MPDERADADAKKLRHWQAGLPPEVEALRKTLCALDHRQVAIARARSMVKNGGINAAGAIDGHIPIWLAEADLGVVITMAEDALRRYYMRGQSIAESVADGPERSL